MANQRTASDRRSPLCLAPRGEKTGTGTSGASRASGDVPVPGFFHSRERGFSLLEILIALVILAIGMIGVIALFVSGASLHRRGVDQSSAALLAETILEGTQSYALEGKTAAEISTLQAGRHVFRPSAQYPGYEYKIICTELSDREYKLILEIRLRPENIHPSPASDTEMEPENVRFETILLRR